MTKGLQIREKGGGVMLFVPLTLPPRERKDLNLFDKTKFDSIGRM